MEIRVLKYFLTVARHGNITRAAEELHLTQPTLSRQLTDLESQLGKKLLIRGRRRVELTEEGIFLKSRAEEIVTLAEQTEAQFSAGEELTTGDIYIGCGETEAMREVIAALAPMTDKYPGIRLHLISGNEESIADKLKKGLLDFGLVCKSVPPLGYMYYKLRHRDTWGLLLRADDPLSKKKVVGAEDLLQHPLIVSQQMLGSSELDNWLKLPAGRLQIIATYNLAHNTVFFAEQGLGSVLCFDRLISFCEADKELVFRPLDPPVHSDNFLIWNKDQVFSKAAGLAAIYFKQFFTDDNA